MKTLKAGHTYWLVMRSSNGPQHRTYWYGGGGPWVWVNEADAMHYSRRADAERIATTLVLNAPDLVGLISVLDMTPHTDITKRR